MASVELFRCIFWRGSIRRRVAHSGAATERRFNFYSWVIRAASYAAVGRSEEVKSAASDTLQHFPDLTIEGFLGTPDWSDADRVRFMGPMRAAGFPACAKPETLAKSPQLVRLPECVSK